MSTPAKIARRAQRQRAAQRARYNRTDGDFLVNDPDGFPSAFPPIHWIGLDSGSGPIGPNGPFSRIGSTPDPISDSGWDYLRGTSTYAAALPVVVRATALITGPLSSAPFRQIELASGRTLTPGRWLTDPMLLRPDARIPGGTAVGVGVPRTSAELNPEWTGAGAGVVQAWPAALRLARSVFWTDWLRSAIWYGKGVFITQRYTQQSDFDDAGNRISRPSGVPIPGTMKLLHPLTVDTTRGPSGASVGALRWAIHPNTDTELVADRDGWLDIGGMEYQIVVLRNPHSPIDEDGRSLGVFDLSPQAFGLERQLETYASGTFRSGIPAGYLKVHQNGLTQEAANKLKSDWLRNHGGDRRSIAVLNAVTEFVPLNLSPVDAALAEVKRLAIADVAFAFGLDPMTLGAGLNNSATYTNLRDAWENHRDFGLSLWIAAVQDTLSALVPSTQAIAIDVEQFGNPTLKEQYEAAAIAVNAGLITPDEWRAERGMPPLYGQEPVDIESEIESESGSEPPAEADVIGLLPTGRQLRPVPRIGGHRHDDQIEQTRADQTTQHPLREATQRAPGFRVRVSEQESVPDRHEGARTQRARASGAGADERDVSARRASGPTQVGRRDPDRRTDVRTDESTGQAQAAGETIRDTQEA